jgi:hypothetical protein
MRLCRILSLPQKTKGHRAACPPWWEVEVKANKMKFEVPLMRCGLHGGQVSSVDRGQIKIPVN